MAFMNDFLQSYSKVGKKKIEWLWYPYIPFGKITILQGDPGDGKSSFVIFLSAVLSKKGKKEIDGIGEEDIRIVYQAAEDDPEDTIKPKLEKFGAVCENIYFIKNNETLTLDSELIEKAIIETKAKLLVLDPLQAFLGDSNITSVNDLRPLFRKLASIAKNTSCAVLVIGHMNKQSSAKELYRGLGSIDIVAIARSVLLLKKAEDYSNYRIVYQIKNNLAQQGRPFAFEFTEEENIHYLGLISDDEGFVYNKESKYDKACKILMNYLTFDIKKSTEIIDIAQKYDISDRTLREAKKKLNVKTIRRKDGWYWTLKDGDLNA